VIGLNIFGMPRGEHGLGQELRDKVLALKAANVPFVVIETNYSSLINSNADEALAQDIVTAPIYDVNLFCLNLPAIRLLHQDRPDFFAGRYNICAPYWEFPHLPASHCAAFPFLHELWVSNSFLASIFSAQTDLPVITLPLHVQVPATIASRTAFQLDPADFIFGSVFDCNSLVARKDPTATILGFLSAFGDNPNAPVKLILKYKAESSPSLRPGDITAFERLAQRAPRILLINEKYSRQAVIELMACFDVFVSPHRAEGLGRCLIEAMLLEKTVMAPPVSGPAEFLSPDWACLLDYIPTCVGQEALGDIRPEFTWYETSISSIARSMHLLFTQPHLARELAVKARAVMRQRCDPLRFGLACAKRLATIKS